jgi:hypothetical protein
LHVFFFLKERNLQIVLSHVILNRMPTQNPKTDLKEPLSQAWDNWQTHVHMHVHEGAPFSPDSQQIGRAHV